MRQVGGVATAGLAIGWPLAVPRGAARQLVNHVIDVTSSLT